MSFLQAIGGYIGAVLFGSTDKRVGASLHVPPSSALEAEDASVQEKAALLGQAVQDAAQRALTMMAEDPQTCLLEAKRLLAQHKGPLRLTSDIRILIINILQEVYREDEEKEKERTVMDLLLALPLGMSPISTDDLMNDLLKVAIPQKVLENQVIRKRFQMVLVSEAIHKFIQDNLSKEAILSARNKVFVANWSAQRLDEWQSILSEVDATNKVFHVFNKKPQNQAYLIDSITQVVFSCQQMSAAEWENYTSSIKYHRSRLELWEAQKKVCFLAGHNFLFMDNN